MSTDNQDGDSYYDKVDGVARWFGLSVSAAFFASLERFSCVNITTFDSDDEDDDDDQDHPNHRPFSTSSSYQSFNSATSRNQNDLDANLKNNTPQAVENLPV